MRLLSCQGGQGDLDAPHAGGDDGTDLEEDQADGAAGRVGEARMAKADAVQRAEQRMSHRRQPQAEPVGAHGRHRGAVGEHVHLTFLDTILNVTAGAVDLLMEMWRKSPFSADAVASDPIRRTGLW